MPPLRGFVVDWLMFTTIMSSLRDCWMRYIRLQKHNTGEQELRLSQEGVCDTPVQGISPLAVCSKTLHETSLQWWLTAIIPCSWFLVPYPLFLVSYPMSLVPGLLSHVPCSWSLVPGLWSLVPYSLSLASNFATIIPLQVFCEKQ